jgi:integrase
LSLWLEDFNISNNTITVRKSKTKNGEKRKVFVQPETMNLFQDYICEVHSDDIDTNFVFINLQGKNKGYPLKDWAVRSLVKRIKKKINIDFTPHMLRHTYATELYDNNVDTVAIQKLLGHAQVQTTIQTYIHPSDKNIRYEWEKAQINKIGGK